MVVTLPPLLTQEDARQRLADDGLGALGLAVIRFAPTWADAALTYDGAALTLATMGTVRAPFLGLRHFLDAGEPTGASDVTGAPLVGPAAAFHLHPQAHVRLKRIVLTRLGGAGAIRPLPQTVILRGVAGTTVDQWFAAGSDLHVGGATFSFHDERGLIVDPVAFAALVQDLATTLPAFAEDGFPAAPGTPGSVGDVADERTGILVHVVDPHGATFSAPASESPVVVDSGGGTAAAIPASGLVELDAGQGIGRQAGATRLRVGWARGSVLGRTPVFPPALPSGVTLGCQFLRACAVDLPWHLLGNRTNAAVQGIGGDDEGLPAEFHPVVRDRVPLDLLTDGVDVVAAGGGVLAALVPGFTGLVFAASPTIEMAVGVPPATGPAGHWPQFPPASPDPPPPVSGSPASGITAVWSGPHDIVATFPGGTIPIGAAVHVYPQVFQVISSIGPEPSFLRGDGSTTVVTAPGPFSLLLENPLRLADGVSQPADSLLVFDLVVTDRRPFRRTFGAVVVPVGSGAPPAAPDPFGTPDPMASVPANVQGVAPSPTFGIPRTGPPPGGGTPTSVVDLIRRLTGETTPRSAPRLPTMARFPTIVAVGTGPTTAPMAWDALVTGGRWARETRSAFHHLGDPGNPAGPDVHVAGVRIGGAGAFDAARFAMRRAMPPVPLGGPFWLAVVGNAGWVPPAEPTTDAPGAPGAPPTTCAAAVLRTVAVGTETPELLPDAIPIPGPTASVQDVIDDLAGALGVSPPPVTIANEDVMRDELREEFHVTRAGRRDALWALRRAIGQARDLVFVTSPQFARTARPDATPQAHEVDLVEALADRLSAYANLRVLIALPLWPDAAPEYGGWIREAFAARNEAVDELVAVDPDRVTVFHPIGFPGRPAPLRTTVVVVDDVWALVGTSHWRRRGMTFDEGVDVVTIDRDLDDRGASRRIRTFRRSFLGSLVQVSPDDVTSADAIRLASPAGSFDLAHDLVAQEGLGRIRPFWRGPTDSDVLAQSHDIADPDGASADQYLLLFAGLIGETPD
jgi:hypothetical protein